MNKEAITIGLTGQTGAGKTTVANELKGADCLIIDADKIARDVVKPGSKCLEDLCNEFGEDICNFDGTLNRSLLAKRAFSNRSQTDKLNSIMHPFIVERIKNIIENNKLNYRLIIIDAPLLIESGLNKICKIVISVVAPEGTRLKRIVKRDKISIEEAKKRMDSQRDEEFYIVNSSYVLNGNKKKELIRKEVTDFISKVGD